MSSAQTFPWRVRDYRKADLPQLHKIDQECFVSGIAFSRVELLFYVHNPLSFTKVAEEAGAIIGFAVGRVDREGDGHIITIDVLPEARRRKVGTALLTSLQEALERRKVSRIFLEVAVDNAPAQRFYEVMGYTRQQRLRGYYKGVTDAYRMVRPLD